MIIKIPGRETVEIKNVIFDYNGTIAIDGQLIEGVAKSINELSSDFNFHVITADTFGSVNNALKDVICTVIKISEQNQDQTKVDGGHDDELDQGMLYFRSTAGQPVTNDGVQNDDKGHTGGKFKIAGLYVG